MNLEQHSEQVLIHLKAALTIREAAAYSNIGINKIDQMLRVPGCPFVLFIGTKQMGKRSNRKAGLKASRQASFERSGAHCDEVKREEFECFISSSLVL